MKEFSYYHNYKAKVTIRVGQRDDKLSFYSTINWE